jgi:hypothetical protein
LTPACRSYIKDNYPSCFVEGLPNSLEKLFVNLLEYTIIPKVKNTFITNVNGFEVEIEISKLKIIYCD